MRSKAYKMLRSSRDFSITVNSRISISEQAISVSDLVNRGTSTARGTRKPVQLAVYKRGSKAKEKGKGGQATPLEVIYDLRVT